MKTSSSWWAERASRVHSRCSLRRPGVRVSLDEFKGRRPIERSGLHLDVRASDFDNPLARSHFEASTGGSRGVGTRLMIDLDLLRYESIHLFLSLQSLGALDRPRGSRVHFHPA